MRSDILDQTKDGNYVISLPKVIGGGYSRGWFSNCKARYRLFCGARNTKKSYNIIGVEPLIKIMSDEYRNILICRKNDSDLRQTAFENICGRINDLGLNDSFITRKNPLEIEYLRSSYRTKDYI